jgi:iron-sulfur cluster assembly protein
MLAIPVTLTEAAKTRIRELTAKQEGPQGLILRIAQGKGCGGNEYRMDHMTGETKGYDRIDAGEGAGLFIPVTDSFMMFGMTIDYGRDELGNEKFLFSNPNEVARCGCGESFSIDPAKVKKP